MCTVYRFLDLGNSNLCDTFTSNDKNVVIRQPKGCGLEYYNCKHTHSIILMARAGPSYECIFADTWANRCVNEGGAGNKSGFTHTVKNN